MSRYIPPKDEIYEIFWCWNVFPWNSDFVDLWKKFSHFVVRCFVEMNNVFDIYFSWINFVSASREITSFPSVSFFPFDFIFWSCRNFEGLCMYCPCMTLSAVGFNIQSYYSCFWILIKLRLQIMLVSLWTPREKWKVMFFSYILSISSNPFFVLFVWALKLAIEFFFNAIMIRRQSFGIFSSFYLFVKSFFLIGAG